MGEAIDISTIMTYVIYIILFIVAIILLFSLFKVNHVVTFTYDKDYKYANTAMKYLATSSCFIYKKENTYPLPYIINTTYLEEHNIKDCIPIDNYELIFYIPSINNKDKALYYKVIENNVNKKPIYEITYPMIYYYKNDYYSGLMLLKVYPWKEKS